MFMLIFREHGTVFLTSKEFNQSIKQTKSLKKCSEWQGLLIGRNLIRYRIK